MAGLDPATHVFDYRDNKTRTPGPRPGTPSIAAKDLMNIHLSVPKPSIVSLADMQTFLEKDFPQLQESGNRFELEEIAYGMCRTRLIYETRHLRPGGTMSGPSMFMLADVSLYIAVLSTVGIVPLAVTTNININFLNRPEPRDLIAHCRLLKAGKRLCVGDVLITSDGSDVPVAQATGTYSVPPVRLNDPDRRLAAASHRSYAHLNAVTRVLGGKQMKILRLSLTFALCCVATFVQAQNVSVPSTKDGVFVAKDFKFHDGKVLPELRLGYKTIGDPSGEPVLILHGTAGSAESMMGRGFAGELFGPGQVLDAAKYYIIIPDALGAAKSSKPSDGLKAAFPSYNYDDMVDAQYRLVTEGLGVKHLRLVLGNSMGGMHSWVWGVRYPDMMDALVPMASQPTGMSSRNWMLRRLLMETIKADPDYKDGNYTTQPKFLRIANVFYATATNGGDIAYQALAPNRAAADKAVEERLAATPPPDANDFIYQWAASADYDPSSKLEAIKAPVLAINSADDERNPPQTGVMAEAMKRVRTGSVYLIPASSETRGHGTTGSLAKLWAPQLKAFLAGLKS